MTNAKAKTPKNRAASTRTIATPAQLRKAIKPLSSSSPVTDSFSAKWLGVEDADDSQRERRTVWYDTQHEHWLGWLKYYDGPGAYGRKGVGYSAEFAYNHIVNPQMLVYLAEAAGIADKTVRKAATEALANRSTMSSMSAAVRRVVPWKTIETALLGRQ
jgi:hypothetical protein